MMQVGRAGRHSCARHAAPDYPACPPHPPPPTHPPLLVNSSAGPAASRPSTWCAAWSWPPSSKSWGEVWACAAAAGLGGARCLCCAAAAAAAGAAAAAAAAAECRRQELAGEVKQVGRGVPLPLWPRLSLSLSAAAAGCRRRRRRATHPHAVSARAFSRPSASACAPWGASEGAAGQQASRAGQDTAPRRNRVPR